MNIPVLPWRIYESENVQEEESSLKSQAGSYLKSLDDCAAAMKKILVSAFRDGCISQMIGPDLIRNRTTLTNINVEHIFNDFRHISVSVVSNGVRAVVFFFA